ncbi:hypothetical protein HU200_038237 [Digitaria exilis]|uniref:Uncharacterized protein n=1 Tax=Digitaria exilis TaxID=1010633 RepID=A0A835BCS1_9POAL|nr:hypothetical protein HU200_038237 [Digitaria exilis]
MIAWWQLNRRPTLSSSWTYFKLQLGNFGSFGMLSFFMQHKEVFIYGSVGSKNSFTSNLGDLERTSAFFLFND